MQSSGSLNRRLLLAAAAFICIALVIAGFILNGILTRFVERQIDQRLDAQLLALAASVNLNADELPQLKRDLNLAPYDRALSGWYWQIDARGGALTSRSLGEARLGEPPRGPAGEPLHARKRDIILPDEAGTVTLTVAAPQRDIEAPIAAARRTLALALAALAIVLGAAMWLQVWLGLSPLRRLAQQVKAVRDGGTDRLPSPQPAEVSELASEVNALLTQNRERLDRARNHVANLAHGLKTPLATLLARLDASTPAATENKALLDLMTRRIAHHLRRARTAAVRGGQHGNVNLASRVAGLAAAMQGIYAERGLTIANLVPAELTAACDTQDVDEMLGNLMDNACKWAKSSVTVEAQREAAMIVISIQDDGPGVASQNIGRMLERGERLDESVAGSGFGLPITREIAALYGGTLDLAAADQGGLRATLKLPA